MNEAVHDATRTVMMERLLAHSPETVWRALTESALIEAWLMPNDFQPKAGHAFSFRAQPQPGWSGVTNCRVIEIEPPRRLVYSWGDGTETSNGLATVVTWTLTPAEGGTRLRMEQSGFGPADERNYRGAEYGWTRFLEGLERVVAGLAETKSLVVERLMPHAAQTIWRALTDSALVARWLMQNDFQPTVGHRFTFSAKPVPGWSGVTNCQVLELEAPRRLVYSWGDGTESDSGLRTLVTWTLSPEGGQTRVRMEQSGFRPQDEAGYRGMGGGWPRILEQLERVAGEG